MNKRVSVSEIFDAIRFHIIRCGSLFSVFVLPFSKAST